MSYASQTSVSVERSKAEIERTLQRYGAKQFIYGWDQEEAVIGFVVEGRQVRFKVQVPDKDDFFRTPTGRRRSTSQAEREWEQAQRQRWRALLLVIKAKLEAIEAGIATFEDEFLAYTMLPSGETVGDWMAPQLVKVYEKGVMPGTLRLALPAGRLMELKIHTLGVRGSAAKQPGEKSNANIHCMIEIDGHLIDAVDRAVLVTKHDEFQTAVVRLIPGEVETIVHDGESWKALAERLKED